MLGRQRKSTSFPSQTIFGSYLNLPAIFIVALMSYVLVVGIKQSATVNNVIVITKVTIVLAVIVFGLQYVNPDHWKPLDRKSTRLNSSHGYISYAVFCLNKKQ